MLYKFKANIMLILKIIMVLMLLIISGCAVAFSPLTTRTEELYQSRKFEELNQYLTSSEGTLSIKERQRILNENINKIKLNQMTTFEFLKYQYDIKYYIKSLTEVGEFNKALKLCDEALKETSMLSDLFIKRNYQYESTIQNNYLLAIDLFHIKGYIVWFITDGNREKTLEIFKEAKTYISRINDSSMFIFDSIKRKKLEILSDDAIFYEKIMGDYRKSLDINEEVLKLANDMNLFDTDIKYAYSLQAYQRMMNLHMKLGELEKAKKTLEKYQESTGNLIYKSGDLIVRQIPQWRDALATLQAETGALFALLQDIKSSEEYFNKALDIVKKIDPQTQDGLEREAIGRYYVLYGTYYLGILQGNYQDAIKSVDYGLNYLIPYYYSGMTDEFDISSAYIYSAELHYLTEDYDNALKQADKSIDYSRKYRNKITEARAYTLKGKIWYKKKNKNEAKKAYERGDELIKKVKKEGIESTENWELYYGLGQLYEDTNKNLALENYKLAVKEVEKLWDGRFKDSEKQVRFIDNRLIVFEPLIRLLAEDKAVEAEKAVYYMESSKSRTFFESSLYYQGQSEDAEKSSLSPADAKKDEELRAEIKSVNEKMQDRSSKIQEIDDVLEENTRVASSRSATVTKKAGTEKKTKEKITALSTSEINKLKSNKKTYENELKEYNKKLDDLNQQESNLLNKNSSRRKEIAKSDPLTATEIKKMLLSSPKTAILEYYVGESSVVGAVITSKSTYVKTLPVAAEQLKDYVMSFRNSIEYLSECLYRKQNLLLYESLVKPFEKELKDIDTIGIIPHGVLHYLPFQALIAYAGSDFCRGISPELMEGESNLLASLKTKQQGNSRTVKVKGKGNAEKSKKELESELELVLSRIKAELAQNEIKENKPKFLINNYKLFYAPSATILNYAQKHNSNKKENLLAVAPVNVKVSSVDNIIEEFDKLPGTKKEVLSVGKLFPAADNYIITDEAATETILKNNIEKYGLILFSTHGKLNRQFPLKSSVYLNEDSTNDGRLTVKEIEDMRFSANLVALSACETGLVSGYEGINDKAVDAKFPYGDDLVGLQRAFMKAGAASVLSTLWEVNDESTTTFMIKFFTSYKNGQDKVSAVQEAANALITSATTENNLDHPYYWSPFILSGDWK